MPATWLTIVAWVSLAAAAITALTILFDIFGRRHRQRMWIMEVVWPVTALYFGPLAWLGYRRLGRAQSSVAGRHGAAEASHAVFAGKVAVGVSHCGAGCTLGDIIGAWIVLLTTLKLAGLALYAEYIVDYALAFSLGILFQYYAIAPMRGISGWAGIKAALKADALSLTAFEVGLFGWMAVMQLIFFPGTHLTPDHAAYWLLMQVGMVLGFATSYPVNWWLIRRGIKEAM
ncbi:MAG: DUF4396 domain-containing protein [Candidatus Dormibacteraeota bacterium]|nr:DUF4396 domain-containing protein [Candidatus Dormibacteraeota bacterium]